GIEHTAEGARQVVHSPEQVVLHLPVAGPASRILAYVIDYLVIVLLELAIFFLLFVILSSTTSLLESLRGPVAEAIQEVDTADPDSFFLSALFWLAFVVFLLVQLAAEWSYFVLFEMSSGGRSLGKLVAGLRVVRDGGLPISFRASAVRNLLRIVDYLPTSYLVGLTSIVVSPEGKRLGDLAAGTLVVRLDRPAPAPPLLEEEDESAADFRFDRAQIARIGRKERALIRQTLRRIDSLSDERRGAALARAVEVLCTKIEHEPVDAQRRADFLRALLRASSKGRS
ncbi:MAG: RDD family protein, partial [Deltaproteobacteria bacterium]